MARAMLSLLASAFLLGACAADIPYADLEARYGGPASRYADLPSGVRVHYRDQGRADGPTIVLLHGFAASLHTWEPWVQRLGGEYRIVSLDLPGHGLTRTPTGYATSTAGHMDTVESLAATLRLPPFVLAGNSMGGAVAWNYAIAHPAQVRALVLVNPAGWPRQGDSGEAPLAFRMMRNPAGRAILRRIDPKPVAGPGLKDAYLDETLVTPELIDRYAALARAPGRREMILSQQAEPRGEAAAATFAKVKVPTLVLHGDDDRVIPLESGRSLARAIPGAQLIVYEKVGHVPMEQIPARSAADVAAFIAGLPPP